MAKRIVLTEPAIARWLGSDNLLTLSGYNWAVAILAWVAVGVLSPAHSDNRPRLDDLSL